MGQLAKKGIFNGRKVPIEGLAKLRPDAHNLDAFSRRCLSACGLELITDKILLKEPLSAKEAELLWQNATLASLIKLVALKYPDPKPLELTPVLYLSLDEMLRKESLLQVEAKLLKLIAANNYPNLRLWVSIRNFAELSLDLEGLFATLKNFKPDLKLIAPSCSRIIAELASNKGSSSAEILSRDLAIIVNKLQKIGFFRLAESGCKDALGVCSTLGMPNHIVSRVTKMDTNRIIKEILMLRALNLDSEVVTSWAPGVEDFVVLNPAREFLVQKSLAFASIFLDRVPCRRINSKAISIDVLRFAHKLGANANVHVAVDDHTARALSLYHVDLLTPYFEITQ